MQIIKFRMCTVIAISNGRNMPIGSDSRSTPQGNEYQSGMSGGRFLNAIEIAVRQISIKNKMILFAEITAFTLDNSLYVCRSRLNRLWKDILNMYDYLLGNWYLILKEPSSLIRNALLG